MPLFSQILTYVLWGLYIFTTLSTIVVILLENRNPVRSLAWLLVLLLLPGLGLLFYAAFGQSFRQQKIIRKKTIHRDKSRNLIVSTKSALDKKKLPSSISSLAKLLLENSDAHIYEDSDIQIYAEGQETFRALFESMHNAKNHIHVEFFIIEVDAIGYQFRDILINKAREGVEVRLIFDYWGSFGLKKSFLQPMSDAGVIFHSFLPAKFPVFAHKINYRNHRKIVVIDGKIGYLGGINIAKRYYYGDHLGAWRDTVLRFEGSAVHGLQSTFLLDWYFVGATVEDTKKYFPKPQQFNPNRTQIVYSGPDTDWENIMQAIFTAVTRAEKHIYIHTPYFMPTDVISTALQTAALKGIDVRLMIPDKSDVWLAHFGNYSYIDEMLKAGVRVFLYNDGFLHSKAIVIDDYISTVGTTNMDFRSYEQNFEVNAFIYEKETALRLKKHFLNDIKKCEEISPEKWNKRSKWQRLRESFARLFSPLM